jgi:hypothetical protein
MESVVKGLEVSYDNEKLLIKHEVADIQLPRPERTLNAPPEAQIERKPSNLLQLE